MRTLLLMGLAALAAGVIPIQATVNGRLGQLLANPLLASLVSFAGGTLAIGALLLLTTPGVPTSPDGVRVPWYLMTGGLLGAVFVTTVLVLAPRIGIANVLAASITGQLIAALIIDHYGLMNLPQSSISFTKIAGGVLLVGGMLLIQRG